MENKTIEVDGSHGEGGGQIIRTSIALSAVTEKPCRIFDIRKGRPNPGLQAQHLEAIKSVAVMCGADVEGLDIGSTEVTFIPGKITSDKIGVNIPTAGSIGLVLQAMMIPASRAPAPVSIEFRGGATNGKWAPPLNYTKNVLLPLLAKMGYDARIDIQQYGYYPKGGAVVSVEINPSTLAPLELAERGKLAGIKGVSHASASLQKARVAERQAEACSKALSANGLESSISIAYSDAACPGSGVELQAIFENSVVGAGALGEKNIKAEDVGKHAAKKLLESVGSPACVDEYAEDQLLPYMALAPPSRMSVPKITSHTRTNIWVIEKFLSVKFEIDEKNKIISVNLNHV